MNIPDIARRLALGDEKAAIRKAAELRRLCDVKFDAISIGVGELCKAVICLEIAATRLCFRLQVLFDRQRAIKLSGMSEKAYTRSFNCIQNGLGIKNKMDVRELAIQFGCVRIIPLVHKGLSLYKDRFMASLPPSRRLSADFTRPVFTAAAFYLCAKKHKLKVDKLKLIELCGSAESEFASVSVSMKDICHDEFGLVKEKSNPRNVKGHRELLDAIPKKRTLEDGGYPSDDGSEPEVADKCGYDEWKSKVMSCRKKNKSNSGVFTRTKQAKLSTLFRAEPSLGEDL